MHGLTDRQRKALDIIRDHLSKIGYPPTLREIGDAMGIRSLNGVTDHVNALQRKGYVARDNMKSRAIRLILPEDIPWSLRSP